MLSRRIMIAKTQVSCAAETCDKTNSKRCDQCAASEARSGCSGLACTSRKRVGTCEERLIIEMLGDSNKDDLVSLWDIF